MPIIIRFSDPAFLKKIKSSFVNLTMTASAKEKKNMTAFRDTGFVVSV